MLVFTLACTPPDDGRLEPRHSDTVATDSGPDTDGLERVDVVVVGSGPAGTAAALTLRERGISVILFERELEPGRGLVMGGRGWAADTPEQAAAGIVDSPDAAIAEWEAVTGVPGTDPVAEAWIRGSASTLAWLGGYGLRLAAIGDDIDGGSVPRVHEFSWPDADGAGGRTLLRNLEGVVRAGVEVTAPLMLDGSLAGVRWRDVTDGSTGATLADAVVLATGGFLRDRDRVDAVAPELAGERLLWETNPSSDGGGLAFLDTLGADAIHPEHIGLYVHAVQDPWLPTGEAMSFPNTWQTVLIGEDGRRFTNEETVRSVYLGQTAPDGEIYALVPAALADRSDFARPYYKWPNPPEVDAYPFAEIAAVSPDVFEAETPEELAAVLGVDPDALVDTILEWNLFVAGAGADPFGRDRATTWPLFGPPWFALRLTTGLAKNFGGVATDADGRVLDVHGAPIRGLYAAGEVTGMLPAGAAGTGFGGSVNACYWSGRRVGQLIPE